MEKDPKTELEIERDEAVSGIVQEPSAEAVMETTQTQPTEVSAEEPPAKQSHGSLFEGIYDQLPDISVRSVDRFIILCVIALVAVILIGVLKANHIF